MSHHDDDGGLVDIEAFVRGFNGTFGLNLATLGEVREWLSTDHGRAASIAWEAENAELAFIEADVLGDSRAASEAAEEIAACHIAAALNRVLRIAGRPGVAPAQLLNIARTVELDDGPDIEIDPRDIRPFGDVFGDAPDGEP